MQELAAFWAEMKVRGGRGRGLDSNRRRGCLVDRSYVSYDASDGLTPFSGCMINRTWCIPGCIDARVLTLTSPGALLTDVE